jgi:hypothetical protein
MLKSKIRRFSRHDEIEENSPKTLDQHVGRTFEGAAGDNRIRLLRFPVSDQTRNVCSGCGYCFQMLGNSALSMIDIIIIVSSIESSNRISSLN